MQNNKSNESLNEDFWNEETNSYEESELTTPFIIKKEHEVTAETIHENDIANIFNEQECLETITGNFTDLKEAMGMENLTKNIDNTYLRDVVGAALENKKLENVEAENYNEIESKNIELENLEFKKEENIDDKNLEAMKNVFIVNNEQNNKEEMVKSDEPNDKVVKYKLNKSLNRNSENNDESVKTATDISNYGVLENDKKIESLNNENNDGFKQKKDDDHMDLNIKNTSENEENDIENIVTSSLKEDLKPANDFWDDSEGENDMIFNLNSLSLGRNKINIENNIFQGGLAIDPGKFMVDAKKDEIYNESDIIKEEYNINDKKGDLLENEICRKSSKKENLSSKIEDINIERFIETFNENIIDDVSTEKNLDNYNNDDFNTEMNVKEDPIPFKNNNEIECSSLDSMLKDLSIKDNINNKNKVYGTIESKYVPTGLIPKANIETDTHTNGFNFNPVTKILYLKNRIIIGLPEKQKRVDSNKKERSYIKTKFEIIKINYGLINILDNRKDSKIDMVNIILKVEKGIDNYINLICKDKLKLFLGGEAEKTYDFTESLIQAYFLNKEIAIEQAISRKNYACALLMSMGTDYEIKAKEAYLENFDPLIRPFFGLSRTNKNWKLNFTLLLRNPNDKVFVELINETAFKERITIFLTFALIWDAKIEFKKMPNCFEFLRVCLNLNLSLKDEVNMVRRYIKVMEESNLDPKKINEKYKFVDDKKKSSWFSGFRSVVDKGISKIVGVDVGDENYVKSIEKSKLEDVVEKKEKLETENKMIYTKLLKNSKIDGENKKLDKNDDHIFANDKNVEIAKNTNNFDKIIDIEKGKKNNKNKVYGSLRQSKINETFMEKKDNAIEINQVSNEEIKIENKNKSLIAKDENIIKRKEDRYEIKEEPEKEKINILVDENKMYKKVEHSQSVDSFSESIIPEAYKDELPVEPPKKPSFFSKFNFFGKINKRYKVELEDNDFFYDNVTKKWISSKAPIVSKSSTPHIVEQTIQPKPVPILSRSVSVNDLTIKNKNRYVNKVKTEETENEVKSFIPKIQK